VSLSMLTKPICTDTILAMAGGVCFWVAVVPAGLQAIGMEFCAQSPQWLYKMPLLWDIVYLLCPPSDLSIYKGLTLGSACLFYGRHFNSVRRSVIHSVTSMCSSQPYYCYYLKFVHYESPLLL
jgi:hypothetical protein